MVLSAYDLGSYFIQDLHMYPGVPLVSEALCSLCRRAIPKSVILMYPLESSTRFSGLISRWMIFLLCRYSKPRMMQAIKNSEYTMSYLLEFLKTLWFRDGGANLRPPKDRAPDKAFPGPEKRNAYSPEKGNSNQAAIFVR